MSSDKKSAIKVVDSVKETQYSNIFRAGFTETEFMIEFGKIELQDNEKVVEVVAKVAIPTEKLLPLVAMLVNVAERYEKHFNKDIGFGFFKRDGSLAENKTS